MRLTKAQILDAMRHGVKLKWYGGNAWVLIRTDEVASDIAQSMRKGKLIDKAQNGEFYQLTPAGRAEAGEGGNHV
jgi:hypothetical protein